MNALLGLFTFVIGKSLKCGVVKLTRINISDTKQIGGANGYAEKR